MAKSHDVCSLEIKEKLKGFYGDKNEAEFADKMQEFDSQVMSVLERAEREGVSPIKAMEMANKEMTIKIKQKARSAMIQAETNKYLIEEFKNQEAFKGKPELAAEAILTNQEGVKYNSRGNIYGTREAIQNMSLGVFMKDIRQIPGSLKKVQSGNYDLEVKKILAGEVSEADMGRMDPFVVAYAKAARKLQDFLHQSKIDSGMNVGYLKNRIAGQYHNAQGMIKLGKEEWTQIAKDSYDWKKMDLEDPDKFLDTMWKDITEQEGKKMFRVGDNMTEVIVGSGKKLEKSRAVHFKSAEASHNYSMKVNNEKSLMQALMMEVERDTGKIAAAQHLGPNYRAGWEKLTENVNTEGWRQLDKKYEVAVHGTKGGGTSLGARMVGATNKISDMSKLSMGVVSTLTDLSFGPGVISSSTGKNYFQSVADTVENILRSVPNRKEAAIYMHANLVDTLDSTFTGRVNEDGAKTNWFSAIHNFGMKATGLPAQSQLFRSASVIQFGRDLHSMKDMSFDILPKETVNRFDKYGIGQKEWDVMRVHGVDELPDGRKVINSGKLAEADIELFEGTKSKKTYERNRLAVSLNALSTELSEVASPTPNSSTMAWRDGTDPDSPLGMTARAMGKYKSFIFSIPKTLKAVKGDEWSPKSIQNLTAVMITATTLKMTVDHLKAIIKDKEPPDYSDPAVWTKAALTSGAGGIVSDFLAQDFGSTPFSSMAEFAAGPGIDVAQDIYSIGSGTAQALTAKATGDRKEQRKQTKRALRDAEKITPALPFMKNTINKNIYNGLHLLLNTGAKR